jgi:protein-disulfide isomerase
MLKQLYRLKINHFIKMVLGAFFLFILSACGDDSDQAGNMADKVERAVSETSVNQQSSNSQSDAMSQETAGEVADDSTDMAAPTDSGFLNYDMVLGDPNAPVEIIEYASITCNHCATFHNNVLPRIKEKYVDTGKVKVVTRSFLLNGIDLQGTAISRCVAPNRYFRFMDAVFERQTQWYDVNEYNRLNSLHDQQTAGQMFVEHSISELSKIARQAGVNQARIDECIASEEIGEYVISIYNEGRTVHKVSATPTILVNGNKTNNDYGSIERAIEAALD